MRRRLSTMSIISDQESVVWKGNLPVGERLESSTAFNDPLSCVEGVDGWLIHSGPSGPANCGQADEILELLDQSVVNVADVVGRYTDGD